MSRQLSTSQLLLPQKTGLWNQKRKESDHESEESQNEDRNTVTSLLPVNSCCSCNRTKNKPTYEDTKNQLQIKLTAWQVEEGMQTDHYDARHAEFIRLGKMVRAVLHYAQSLYIQQAASARLQNLACKDVLMCTGHEPWIEELESRIECACRPIPKDLISEYTRRKDDFRTASVNLSHLLGDSRLSGNQLRCLEKQMNHILECYYHSRQALEQRLVDLMHERVAVLNSSLSVLGVWLEKSKENMGQMATIVQGLIKEFKVTDGATDTVVEDGQSEGGQGDGMNTCSCNCSSKLQEKKVKRVNSFM